MSKNHEIMKRLQAGETVKTRLSGNSMTPRIKSRQLVTIEPCKLEDLKVGDAAYCKVNGNFYLCQQASDLMACDDCETTLRQGANGFWYSTGEPIPKPKAENENGKNRAAPFRRRSHRGLVGRAPSGPPRAAVGRHRFGAPERGLTLVRARRRPERPVPRRAVGLRPEDPQMTLTPQTRMSRPPS